jgi:hypothetical protein
MIDMKILNLLFKKTKPEDEDLEALINRLHKNDEKASAKLEELRNIYKEMKWDISKFPKDEKLKSTKEGKLLAFLVGLCAFCPDCNTESIRRGPCGGISINMICEECGARYWMTDPEWAYDCDLRVLMAFGCYQLNEGQR